VHSRRQPGSAFKPFVYLAALDPSRRGEAAPRTVVSPLEDAPLTVSIGSQVWQPANYDGTFAGVLPLEDALAGSLNTATVRLAMDVGIDAVAGAATDLGIRGPLPRVPALALGVAETSLLELTAAYGVFASGGLRRTPVLVVAVASSEGETLYAAPSDEQRVLDPGVAYLVTHLLERVVDTGTARSARSAGLAGPAAGKTGTTDDTRDAWFVGFTPDVLAGVWVGFDDGAATGLTGAQGALPVWTDFVRAVARPDPPSAFPVPDDIVWRDVDPASGLLATAGCAETRHEPFLAGTEPTQPCDRHQPVLTTVGDGIGNAVREGGRAVESGGRKLFGWFGRLFR
jgi:membrane carboxypeptidase/penicillin-binding protein